MPDNLEFDEYNNKIYIGSMPSFLEMISMFSHIESTGYFDNNLVMASKYNYIDLN